MLSTTVALFWLALAWAGAPPPCAACDCAETSVDAAVEAANAVFIGRVLGVNEAADEENDTRTPARLLVQERLKGGLPSAVTVATAISSTACGYHFEVGERYLVYAMRRPARGQPTRLWTSTCMRTSPLTDVSGEELAYLRALE